MAAAPFRLEDSGTPDGVVWVLTTLVNWLNAPEQTGLQRGFWPITMNCNIVKPRSVYGHTPVIRIFGAKNRFGSSLENRRVYFIEGRAAGFSLSESRASVS